MPLHAHNRGANLIAGVIGNRDLVRISVVMSSAYGVAEFLSESYFHSSSVAVRSLIKLVWMLSVWSTVVGPLRRKSLEADRASDIERQLSRGLDMARTESECYDIARFAFERIAPGENLQLLLTDSSEAHLRHVLDDHSQEPACGVRSPNDCPAVRAAQTVSFTDTNAIDLCPHLRSLDHPVPSVCTPVTMLGRAAGVIHHFDVHERPNTELVETAAHLIGGKISMIRALTSSTLQASTDPLTGLFNRRSLENQANAMLASGTEVTVALVDLDHFKDLNDTHGHAAGDRALASFARLMAEAVRKSDLVSRYGGEEFVLVLVNQSLADAELIFGRLQRDLTTLNERSGMPPFTFSAGIAHSSQSRSLHELVALADTALMQAKNHGRNMIVRAAPDAVIDTFGWVEAT